MKPQTLAGLLVRIRACDACRGLPFGPRPVIQAHPDARVALIGHAPGRLVHASGIPWDDLSGDRLREWLGVSRRDFYDSTKIALVGMGFCYPGTGKSGDLPPREECAPLWHETVFSHLRGDLRRVLIGRYALKYYLGKRAKKTLTETVKPHPSGRNNGWLVKNPWFEREALPGMRAVFQKSLRQPSLARLGQ
jgi:uracil-DNA glycosylase